MTSVAALGAAATVIATAFALCTIDRWLDQRRAHELAWSQSLVMFALASGAYWWGAATGWTTGSFRVFYLFGAILNVPYLAVGTVHLLWPGPRAARVHAGLNLVSALCAGVLVATPARPVARDLLPVGRDTFGLLPRILAGVGSGGAAVVLIGGALYSAARLIGARRRLDGAASTDTGPDRSRLGRLAVTNGLVALGSLILGIGGAGFTGRDAMAAFGVFLTLGIAVLFAGFLVSSPGVPAVEGPAVPESLPASLSPFMEELWELAHARRSGTT